MDTVHFHLYIPLLTAGSRHSRAVEKADTARCLRGKQRPLPSQCFLVPMGEDPTASASRSLPQI